MYSQVMIATEDRLGIGIYTPAEAAFYARVSQGMMTRWVFGDSKGKAVIERQIRDEGEKVVTFLDFVQTLAVREVRRRHNLPLQRIRQGIDEARKKYGIDYPLAREHCIFLFSDQRGEGHGHIVIRIDEGEGKDELERRYVQLTGRGRGQYMIQEVVEMFLSDLRFDPSSKLATEYRPLTQGGASILLNPHRRFGEPVVEPSGYTAETLWHATNTEGGIDAAVSAYGVSVDEVILANKYFDMLEAKAA